MYLICAGCRTFFVRFAANRTTAMAMWKICQKYTKVGTLFFQLSSSSTHARYASSSVTIIIGILLIITALTIDIVIIVIFFFILFLFFLWMQLLPTTVPSCQRFRDLVIPE